MPVRYEAIRDSLVKKGKSMDEAQRIAAATYNKTLQKGEKPMGRKTHK